jgi:RimJ/RimL family protein N-acetyltransferase
LIGYCGFKPAGDFVDLGYQYGKEAWGQGIGLEAAKTIREFGLSKLGITNMEAGGSIQNLASVKIMEHLGFANREELIFDGQPAIRFFD